MATKVSQIKNPPDTIAQIQYQLTICSRELRQGCPKRSREMVLRHANQLLDAWLRLRNP